MLVYPNAHLSSRLAGTLVRLGWVVQAFCGSPSNLPVALDISTASGCSTPGSSASREAVPKSEGLTSGESLSRPLQG